MEQMSGVYMEGLGREGLLAKLNPEEGTCVSKFLLLSEFFCQVSVFSPPNSGSLHSHRARLPRAPATISTSPGSPSS